MTESEKLAYAIASLEAVQNALNRYIHMDNYHTVRDVALSTAQKALLELRKPTTPPDRMAEM